MMQSEVVWKWTLNNIMSSIRVQKQSTDFVDSAEKWQKVSYGQQQRIWRGIEDEFSLFIARYCEASTPQSFHSLLQQDWLRKQRFVLSSCWLLKRHPCITLKTLLTLLSTLFPY